MLYEEQVIDKMAERLYRQAASLVVTTMLIGSLGTSIVFVAFQYATGLGNGLCFGVVGLLLGMLLGLLIGQSRALALRFQAQQALLMREIERNTRSFRASEQPRTTDPVSDAARGVSSIRPRR